MVKTSFNEMEINCQKKKNNSRKKVSIFEIDFIV